jgi:hypothetical protein
MRINKIANTIIAILWIASFIFAVIWVKDIPFKYEPEPITFILGMVSIAVTGIVKWYTKELEKEKFTVAHVLAKGYVNNFLEPVLTEIIKNSESEKKPVFYIFIPDYLSDLTEKSIDRLKAKFKERGLLEDTIEIKLREGRGVRDVMTISNSKQENVYFDFPNTICALTDFVDYKMNSPKDSLDVKKRNKLGEKYIERFKQQLIETLKEKKLYPDFVKFTNCDMEIDL